MANILVFFIAFFHPFYVSVTEINHNLKSKSLEISCKIFYDDMEKALEKDSKVKLDILDPANKREIGSFIKEYVSKHFKIIANNKHQYLNFIGYEIQEDAVWCYFETGKINKINRLEVINDILFDLYDSQINILNAKVVGKRLTTKLERPNNRAVFRF